MLVLATGQQYEKATMYQDLIEFWFSEEASKHWFNSTKAFDRALLEAHEQTWLDAKQARLDHWQQSAVGSLALVILLDQLPLNMFRGQAKSFATESQSRDVARAAIAIGFDQELTASRKAFLYMPFMHSEELDDQALGVKLFDQPGLESNHRFARHHYGIIERFGRFPHRNKILGRESTDAEIEYLNSKQSFQG
ncbi:MAG: DUF924 domain-containing protein [Gammaproteobacteria bacterium]|nr:DUF924 domain-containing protein [Gammaproteobacteria bacterium]